jgi:hypothetical protein
VLHVTFEESKESILSLPLTKAEETFYILGLLQRIQPVYERHIGDLSVF